jgi:phosphoribosylamine---glycine ligase
MKVLLVGSGGREDALAWALARSPELALLRCAPGNGGMRGRAECIEIEADDVDALFAHAARERYDLVVIGPEVPLVAGLADRLTEAGIAVFGPSAAAARIEGSKVFSKELMRRHGIPTASFEIFDDCDAAEAYIASGDCPMPCVVKADGLAAGKGVLMCDNASQAVDAVRAMLIETRFGAAGRRIVIEECLRGREASFFVLSDGEAIVELATCQDYKRALDGDRGLNTGGMGTYSPSVYLDDAMRRSLMDRIVRPTIDGMAAEGMPYRGVLYTGVMLTDEGPKVLEYNARFGDPETQVLMPRLDGDWLALLHACAEGRLASCRPRWHASPAVCVVMTAGGYPGAYEKNLPIHGVSDAEEDDRVVVFHAGTRIRGDTLLTAGGRVLGVTATGSDLNRARLRAYAAVNRIDWQDEHHRTDIALDAIER